MIMQIAQKEDIKNRAPLECLYRHKFFEPLAWHAVFGMQKTRSALLGTDLVHRI